MDLGRHRVQLAAAPPSVDVPSRGLRHRGERGRKRDGLGERVGADVPPKGHGGLHAQAGLCVLRDTGTRVEPYPFAADFPVVGEPCRRGERRLPERLSARRQRGVRPRQTCRFVVPHRHGNVLQDGLFRGRGYLELQEHLRANVVHGRQLEVRLRGRVRERHQGRHAARSLAPFLAGKEAVDVGQWRLRTGVGPESYRPSPPAVPRGGHHTLSFQ